MDPVWPTATLHARHRSGLTGASSRAATAKVRLLTSTGQFLSLAGQWDALSLRCGDGLFHRHEFIRLWLDHFAGDAEPRILTLHDVDGRLTAALPLIACRSRLYGFPVREWQAAANLHSCRFDLLADDPVEAADAFARFLSARRDWDVLRLIDVPRDGRAQSLVRAAGNLGLASGRWESLQSPTVALPSSWGEFEQTLQSKFRANLRRRRRRLADRGHIELERFSGGPALPARLDEGLALEASGWKGRAGSAIRQDPQLHGFYRALASDAAARGRLALWFLRLDGRAIAFHFSLEHRGRLLLLKPAYDEAFADTSPGQLLTEDVLRDSIQRGLHEFDFLGPDMPWKRDWTRRTRPHQWIYLCRGLRGRLLHRLKFGLVPFAKRITDRGNA